MTLLDLSLVVVLGLACYRATRLVTRDSITESPRMALYTWAWDDDGAGEPVARSTLRTYIYEALTCAFCVGVWCALVVTWMVYGVPWSNWHAGRWALTALAIAGVQALLTSWRDST